MRRCAVLALGLALAAPAPAVAAEVPRPHPRCYPKGADAVAASSRVRLYSVAPDIEGIGRTYACDLLNGRRAVVSRRDTNLEETTSHAKLRFAGRVAGFEERTCLRRNCQRYVGSIDAGTRQERTALVLDDEVTDLVVSPSGAAAWIARTGDRRRVVAMTAAGTTELDGGRAVEPGSLALSDGRDVYWTNTALPRRAALEPPPATRARPVDPAFGGRRSCWPAAGETLAGSTRARVYGQSHSDLSERFFVCNLRTGRRTLVFEITDQENFGFEHVRFAGWYVALAGRGCIKVDCGAGVVQRVDLRTGELRSLQGGQGGDVSTSDLVLRPDGTTAWIFGPVHDSADRGCCPRQVHRCDSNGCQVLDRGPGVEPGSLALASSGRLYWTASGLPRSRGLP